ncbi:MAG: hypothetical protein U9P80_05920, partial [Thermodesulfobacteriota bacterium]|nr:hypothetical protein [Thermodesulfobacteriota bacterium]
KKQLALRTAEGPDSMELVRNGLGIMLNTGVLDKLKGPLGDMLEVELKALSPANESARNSMDAALNADVGIPVNLAIKDGLDGRTADNNANIVPKMNMDIGIPLGAINIPLPDFLVKALLGEADALDMGIGGMLSGLDLAGIELNLDESTYMFVDLYGLPGMATDNVACLGAGLFMADVETEIRDDEIHGVFPENVSVFDLDNAVISPYGFGFVDPGILDPYLETNALGVDFSQEALSQFVGALLEGQAITMDATELPIPLAIPDYGLDSTIKQEVVISFNPDGFGFDFRQGNQRIMINDLQLEYRENDIPKWLWSLDMTVDLTIGWHIADAEIKNEEGVVVRIEKDHSFMDITLELVDGRSHCHVMKDDFGVSVYDHSDFVDALFAEIGPMLGAPEGGPVCMPLDLTDMAGMTLNDLWTIPGNGRCFLGMAATEMNPSCFISTAGF